MLTLFSRDQNGKIQTFKRINYKKILMILKQLLLFDFARYSCAEMKFM